MGGYTNDPAFVPQPLSGFYQQPGYNLDHYDNLNTGTPFDGFLVRFNDLQQRTWATLFGGSAGMVYPEHENIMGTGYIGDRFYAVGYTSKPIGIPAAYFPLDDNQGNPYTWFNPLFNYNGFTSSYTDGFIARFCNENTIGIQNVEKPNAAFTVVPETENALHLTGLNDGTHTVELYDAQGKRILSAKLQSQAGLTGTLVHGSLQSAMYVVHVDGRLVSRFIPIR